MNLAGEQGDGSTAGQRIRCRSFIKWVGGKSQLLPELIKRLPRAIGGRYYEPFVGGGALFFAFQPHQATLTDLNDELINAYTMVRDCPEELIDSLSQHRYDEEYFYQIRNVDRTEGYAGWDPVSRASRFIFLNKTCYNGLYRVNGKGFFNTPFGRYTNPTIVDHDNLRACSKALNGVHVEAAGFQNVEDRLHAGDFVYFDPPYVPLSATASFTGYQPKGFDLAMQQELFELCCRLDSRGIKFMLSNSSAPYVRELFRDFNVELVGASRAINSKAAKRGKVDEVIVRNYGSSLAS